MVLLLDDEVPLPSQRDLYESVRRVFDPTDLPRKTIKPFYIPLSDSDDSGESRLRTLRTGWRLSTGLPDAEPGATRLREGATDGIVCSTLEALELAPG